MQKLSSTGAELKKGVGYIIQRTMRANEGVITKNILHVKINDRSANVWTTFLVLGKQDNSL